MRGLLPASLALSSTLAFAQKPLLIEHVRIFDGARVLEDASMEQARRGEGRSMRALLEELAQQRGFSLK